MAEPDFLGLPPSQEEYDPESPRDPDDELSEPSAFDCRHSQLDVLRAACVCWVVGCHAYGDMVRENPLFVLNWVMQYISLISGVVFAMSRAPVIKYFARLVALFILGSALNGIPIGIRKALGRSLLNSAGGSGATRIIIAAIWQFWYVPVLIVAVLVLTPLKFAVHKQERVFFMRIACVTACVCGALAVWTIVLFANGTLPLTSRGDLFALDETSLYVLHLFGHLFISIVGLWRIECRWSIGKSSENGGEAASASLNKADQSGSWLGWALICYTYMLVIVMEVERVGQFCIFVQLMICGFVLYRAPLKHRARLQNLIHATWPILVFVLFFASVHLKIDIFHFSHTGIFDRARCACINMIFVAIFALLWCPCAVEKTSPGAIGASWRMGDAHDVSWLATWSLSCYIIHVVLLDMAFIVFPNDKHKSYVQAGVILSLFALAVPCNSRWGKKCYKSK
eukprot:GEMP01019775.1.p1 GENE.GEMP01019775.1~~GEMP01019775.1.p1  ORF type:complete len:454 (+),score=86.19 GEMP01019775.1:155-1516(+)